MGNGTRALGMAMLGSAACPIKAVSVTACQPLLRVASPEPVVWSSHYSRRDPVLTSGNGGDPVRVRNVQTAERHLAQAPTKTIASFELGASVISRYGAAHPFMVTVALAWSEDDAWCLDRSGITWVKARKQPLCRMVRPARPGTCQVRFGARSDSVPIERQQNMRWCCRMLQAITLNIAVD